MDPQTKMRTTSIDVLSKGNGGWKKTQSALQDLITEAESHDILIAFLPSETTLATLQVDSKLTAAFHIPASFWKSIALEASGFFGCREIESSNGAAATQSMFFRFLIKEPVKRVSTYHKNQDAFLYTWHKLGFFTSWNAEGKTRILCFDIPAALQEAITRSVMLQDLCSDNHRPFVLHGILVEEIVALFDKSVWLWRDVVRDLEKNRPTDEPPRPDYIKLHEIGRHIIHSSETLAVASETVNSIIEYQGAALRTMEKGSLSSKNLQNDLQHQASLMKCLHLRSQAVESRLRNEVNLAFHLVAQYDSRCVVQISTNTATDSAAMKTISVLGLVFLPGTFICAIFSTSFFNFNPGSDTEIQRWVISDKFWIYFAVAIPVTLATILSWAVWTKQLMPRATR